MDIPLDDLLPTSDEAFQSVLSGEFFNTGAPFWEMADFHKWPKPSGASKRYWMRFGYMAGLFETALKSGRPFRFPMNQLEWQVFADRAEAFGRTAKMIQGNQLLVSGHQ